MMFWKGWKMREKVACHGTYSKLSCFPPCLNPLCLSFVHPNLLQLWYLKLAGPFTFPAFGKPCPLALVHCQNQWYFYVLHACPQAALCVCPVRGCSRFGDCHGEQLGEFEKISLAEDVQGGCLAYSSLLKLCKFLILPFPAQTFWVLGPRKKRFSELKIQTVSSSSTESCLYNTEYFSEEREPKQYVSRQEECRKITGCTSCSLIAQ